MKKPLAPGDILVTIGFNNPAIGHETALVVAIDLGRTSHEAGGFLRRVPASLTLLLSGPSGERLFQCEFGWLSRYKFVRVDEL